MNCPVPISAKFRRPEAEKLAAAKAEFDQLERDGIIRRSRQSMGLSSAHGEEAGW
jgi:hypothetical protein